VYALMASGIDYFTCALVRSSLLSKELLIVDVEDKFKDVFDGFCCSDNGFVNSEVIPETPGIYLTKCELCWDDGKNGMCEDVDPDFEIRILSFDGIPISHLSK
jgi:hypothetical protein